MGAAISMVAVALPFFGKGNPDRAYITSPMKARGTIRDASGVELTQYADKESAWLDLGAARKWHDTHPEEWERFSTVVAEGLNIPKEKIEGSLNIYSQFRYLKRWLSPDESCRLRETLNQEWSMARETVRIMREPATFFPFGKHLAPLLGFTNIDGQGASGLEFEYEDELTGHVDGSAGYWSFTPRKGSDLYLSIDMELQRACEFVLESYMEKYRAESIEAVVLRASDSRVLAIVSLPSFDPNNFRAARHAQMRLRPVTDIFHLGPVIQPFFMAEGMETKGDGFTGQRVPDSSVTLSEAFLGRSPAAPLHMAKDLGPDGTLRAISRFRLDQRTGVDFGAEPLPIVARSGSFEMALSEFVKGYGVAVPLHRLALSFCALVNGGELREPNFVDRLGMPDGEMRKMPDPPVFKVIQPEVSAKMRKVLKEGVQRAVDGKPSPDMGGMWATYAPKLHHSLPRNHHVAAALFAPVDKPKVVVVLKMILPKDAKKPGRDIGLHMSGEILEAALLHLDDKQKGDAHEHR